MGEITLNDLWDKIVFIGGAIAFFVSFLKNSKDLKERLTQTEKINETYTTALNSIQLSAERINERYNISLKETQQSTERMLTNLADTHKQTIDNFTIIQQKSNEKFLEAQEKVISRLEVLESNDVTYAAELKQVNRILDMISLREFSKKD